MEKIITVFGKNYKIVPNLDSSCEGCAANVKEDICSNFMSENEDSCQMVTFQEVNSVAPQVKPTIQMNLELDLSNCILPVFFTVKNLRLQSLDTALKNQSDAYNISVKDLPQETLEIVAEELKQEFIRRNTKV